MICKLVIFLFTLVVSTQKAHAAYGYFKLSIQWPPTFCQPLSKCVPEVLEEFNIHGLWPEIDCNQSVLYNRTQISPIRRRLQKSMKSLQKGMSEDKFWGKEWKKHGTCSLETFNQLAYFNQTLNLFNQTGSAMLKELNKSGIIPGGPPMRREEFNLAMKNIHNVDVELACNTNNNLEEVRFCVHHNGQTFINCPSSGRCKGNVTLPKVEKQRANDELKR